MRLLVDSYDFQIAAEKEKESIVGVHTYYGPAAPRFGDTKENGVFARINFDLTV